MIFLKKSIIRRLFLNLLLFALLIAAIAFYFYYRGREFVPYYVLIVALGIFLLYFLVTYYVDIVRPLRLILGEMQALITGKPYKRIYTERIDEIGIIAYFFNQMTKGLQEVSYDIKDRDRMISDLNIASQLQRDILPLESNPQITGLDICAKSKPATELGGDSFNYFTVGNKTYIYIGDVTGHGVAAGLIMTMANSLIGVFADIYNSPYEILINVNKYIKKHIKKAMYMTLVMLCWDHVKQKMTYVGAGHEHILIYRATTGECEAIISGGIALGMVPDNSKVIAEKEIPLAEGDFVVLYSDGIIEAKNTDGKLFGLDKLRALVSEYAAQYSPDGINYHIATDVSKFIEGHGQDDDMSLIVIKRLK